MSLKAIMSLIKRYWLLSVINISIMVTLAIFYNKFSTPLYMSSVTFFVNVSKDDSRGANLLGGYSRLLGSAGDAALGKKIFQVIKSDRICDAVRNRLGVEKTKSQADVLGLKKNISITKNDDELYCLSYLNKDPEMARKVLMTYIEVIGLLNQEMELSSEKQLLNILDYPKVPLIPSKPRKMMNIVFGLMAGICLSLSIVAFREALEVNE